MHPVVRQISSATSLLLRQLARSLLNFPLNPPIQLQLFKFSETRFHRSFKVVQIDQISNAIHPLAH
ncbi:unnamed protein product [Hymenolepis diminuta]|uniref:Uncharacterized protein n=1 Tax=Hymenolepis diminuta TaxID=6216 RepID=A0A564YKU0_HYMDI|nr:unnamed protein product [Hymenolepis diminuta]